MAESDAALEDAKGRDAVVELGDWLVLGDDCGDDDVLVEEDKEVEFATASVGNRCEDEDGREEVMAVDDADVLVRRVDFGVVVDDDVVVGGGVLEVDGGAMEGLTDVECAVDDPADDLPCSSSGKHESSSPG